MIDQTVSLLSCSTLCWAIPQANLIARWKWGWSSPHSGKNPLKTSNLRIFTYQPLSGFPVPSTCLVHVSDPSVLQSREVSTRGEGSTYPTHVSSQAESDPPEEKEARVPSTCPIRVFFLTKLSASNCNQLPVGHPASESHC